MAPWCSGAGIQAFVVLLALLASAGAGAVTVPPGLPESDIGVSYGPLAGQVGDIWKVAGTARLRPAVLIIHGGGWAAGERTTETELCKILAGKGFVVFNIDYRLADLSKPETRWPAQLLDAQLAVRYLRANSQKLGIDRTRIGAVGDSVGGTLALSLALRGEAVPGDMAYLYAGEASTVNAAVDEFGPIDGSKLPVAIWRPSNLALFGTETPSPVQTQAVSPLNFMTYKAASILIVHGDADQVVPRQQSELAVKVLRVNDVRVQFVSYHGGHGFLATQDAEFHRIVEQVVVFLSDALMQPRM